MTALSPLGYGYTEAYHPPDVRWRCAKLTSPGGFIYARACMHGNYAWVFSDNEGTAPYPNNSVSMRSLVANGNNASQALVAGYAQY